MMPFARDEEDTRTRKEVDPDLDSGDESTEEESEFLLKTKNALILQDEHGSAAATSGASVSLPLTGADQSGPLVRGTGSKSAPEAERKKSKETVAWSDLPQKQQLAVITLTRLSEPLVQTSLQAYMFYQLKWFDPSLPDSIIASQAGILHASFTAAQFLTAMMWGRVADSSRSGRKTVVLVGLTGTMVSCIGFGFSRTFWQALFFRSLGGITNGNVGVLRTMISEIVREKKYQSRAFLLLPITFNIGVIVGPVLGGVLSAPAESYPSLFDKVDFFVKYPYATPNLVSAFFLFSATLVAWLCLEETLDSRRDKSDWGLELGKKIGSALCFCLSRNKSSSIAYEPLASVETGTEVELTHSRNTSTAFSSSLTAPSKLPNTKSGPRYTQRLPFRRIFTRNVSFTFLSQFCLAFHVGTFNSLWFVFLSTPVYDPSKQIQPGSLARDPPFIFTGGLGLPPRSVGMAMAILGVLGICLQLFLYPTLSARMGTVRSWRLFLLCFPVAYFLLPYLSLVPSSSPPPSPKSGPAVWFSIGVVLFIQVIARTFVLPSQTILVNNCTPHPSVLGTVHGLGLSVSSAARTIGPMLCGFLYGLGLAKGIVGAVFWGLAGVAMMGWLVSWWVREGDGHEIWLEGDDGGEEGGLKAREPRI